VKPDLVHFGGNFALVDRGGGHAHWVEHILLGEPTLILETNGRFVGSETGTSFAVPHVAHAAAVAARNLRESLGREPTANLVRALVGAAASMPSCEAGWLDDEDDRLRLIGYGFADVSDPAWSRTNRAYLIAEDAIEEDRLHIYRLQLPSDFLARRGVRGISIALAYDPPVRASRRAYLARTMWFELIQGLSTEEVELYRSQQPDADVPPLPPSAVVSLRPPRTKLQWSTLQVRKRVWSRPPRLRAADPETEEPWLHLLVGCQKRFETGLPPEQRYALSVLVWHEDTAAEIYQQLRTRVRVPPVRVRV
jgi:hypothetical protein